MGRKLLRNPNLIEFVELRLACACCLSRDDGASNILNIRAEIFYEDINLESLNPSIGATSLFKFIY
jgi:hypothetical protein